MKITDAVRRGAPIMIAVALLIGCGSDEQATTTPTPLAGTYVLDREDYLRVLLADAQSWAESTAAQRPATEQADVLAASRKRARGRAASTQFRLTIDPAGTFQMEIEQGDGVPPLVGRGSWAREGAALTLDTKEVEGGPEAPPDMPPPPEDGPPLPDAPGTVPLPPPLEATIDGDTLIMKPGPGVPFQHRLVRSR